MAKVYVPVRLEQEMVAAIDELASAQGLTRSEMLRILLEASIWRRLGPRRRQNEA